LGAAKATVARAAKVKMLAETILSSWSG